MRKDTSPYTYLERKIVYGPVKSRRLGTSVGINLFPGEDKVCSLDCVYCFFPKRSSGIPDTIPEPNDVISALDAFFDSNQRLMDSEEELSITFSGNGEPTLHPKFPEIVQAVHNWRDIKLPRSRLVVFTNSTQINRQEILNALLSTNRVFLKLDWGDQADLERISRPIQPLTLQEIVDGLKSLTQEVKKRKSKTQVIIQTALYTNGRPLEAWKKWAELIKKISPIEVNLYELDWPGTDFDPAEFFDFHSLRRYLYQLLRDEPTNLDFIFSAPFCVNVDLCYAVDSLIYLPLYVAEYARLFEKHEVRMNYFVSPDGDPGAVKALTRGVAEFAICDPLAAIDILANKNWTYDPRYEPVLVAILINHLALWCVSTAQGPTSPREAILASKEIVTYECGSTANYVWNWQLHRLPENIRPEKILEVKPGEEFRSFCENSPNIPISIISADLLGAYWCKSKCGERGLSIIPYANTDFGKKFMFTGLLASRDVLRRYPGAVNGVVAGLLNAIEKLNDRRFRRSHLTFVCEFVEQILRRKRPIYLERWPGKSDELQVAISHAIHELRRTQIYSNDGRFRRNVVGFYRAIMIRGKNPLYSRLPILKLFRLVTLPAGGYPMRFLICLIDQIQWLALCTPLKLALIGASLVSLTSVTVWLGMHKVLGLQTIWHVIAILAGNLAAAVIFGFYHSFKSWKGKKL